MELSKKMMFLIKPNIKDNELFDKVENINVTELNFEKENLYHYYNSFF